MSLLTRHIAFLASIVGALLYPNIAHAQIDPTIIVPGIIVEITRTESSWYSGQTSTQTSTVTTLESFSSFEIELPIDLWGERDAGLLHHNVNYLIKAYVRGPISGAVPYLWSRTVGGSEHFPCLHGHGPDAHTDVYKPADVSVQLGTGFTFQYGLSWVAKGEYFADAIVTGPPSWGIGSTYKTAGSGGGGTNVSLPIADAYEKSGVSGTVSTPFAAYPGHYYFRVMNETINGRLQRSHDKSTVPYVAGGHAHLYAVTKIRVDLPWTSSPVNP